MYRIFKSIAEQQRPHIHDEHVHMFCHFAILCSSLNDKSHWNSVPNYLKLWSRFCMWIYFQLSLLEIATDRWTFRLKFIWVFSIFRHWSRIFCWNVFSNISENQRDCQPSQVKYFPSFACAGRDKVMQTNISLHWKCNFLQKSPLNPFIKSFSLSDHLFVLISFSSCETVDWSIFNVEFLIFNQF